MKCSLENPATRALLQRLHDAADAGDDQILAAAHRNRSVRSDSEIAALLGEAYLPVSPDVGRFLYLLVRSSRCKTVVEFGTSFGISTIYLAAAVCDHGGGKVIATEINPNKAERARANIREAGLAGYVELRQGDALETLRGLEPVDFLLLDGWKDLYLPVLKLVQPALQPGALIVADDLDKYPEVHLPYLEFIRDPANGYVSVEVPMGDRLLLAMRSA
jgi:predicted O-methyltransferase YrrM